MVVGFFKRRAASPKSQREDKEMRKLVVVLMAVGMFGAMPAFAAEHEGMKMMDAEGQAQECVVTSGSIQDKVLRIQKEIKEGSKKYSPEELKKLQKKLDETNKMLKEMYGP